MGSFCAFGVDRAWLKFEYERRVVAPGDVRLFGLVIGRVTAQYKLQDRERVN
jgi:hypothetical protein